MSASCCKRECDASRLAVRVLPYGMNLSRRAGTLRAIRTLAEVAKKYVRSAHARIVCEDVVESNIGLEASPAH